MRTILFLSAIVIFFIGCEKDVTVPVPDATTEIVVEGLIEVDTPAVVLLSRTLPFFGEIDMSDVYANSITGATVIVEDGISVDTLTQFLNYGIYIGNSIRGVEGRTYKLTVIAEGKTLTAVTTIPHKVYADSVWWKPEGTLDSLGWAWIHFKDPDTLGNCYRMFTQRISHYTYGDDAGKMKDTAFIISPGATFEDKFINNRSFDVNFARGSFTFSDKTEDQNDEKYYFKRGDTIVMKFCSIDFQTEEFWSTEEQQVQNNGNPFASPAPITSNITGGLGVWSGYAPTYDTIVAQ
jgi:hypothetical protein